MYIYIYHIHICIYHIHIYVYIPYMYMYVIYSKIKHIQYHKVYIKVFSSIMYAQRSWTVGQSRISDSRKVANKSAI